jgi:two-component system sensor histidine kinase ChvG
LLAIFLALPILIFVPFKNADDERNDLLIASVRDQGRLVAEGVRPVIERDGTKAPAILGDTLARFAKDGINARILFRPANETGANSFYIVAAAPTVSNDYLETERANFVRMGVFDNLNRSCQGDFQSATEYTNPKGEGEILTSIMPINLPNGCWLVVTTHPKANFPIVADGQPLWATPQIGMALIVYALMAIVIASLFGGIWRSLRRFGALAREIRAGADEPGTFVDRNAIPELGDVAGEFDHMVHALRASADGIRQAAEENAHALKAPLAVISQSVEPLRKLLPIGDARAARALELIDRSVERLDALVSAARQMDETNAELVDPPRERIDLSRLMGRMAGEYRLALADRNVRVVEQLEPSLWVLGGEEMLETVAENLLDNAAGFSQPGAEIKVSLRRIGGGRIQLTVDDQGPGVDDTNLDRIFRRYVSIRGNANRVDRPGNDPRNHFGIGLWIVRRNIEAMGGTITARNRENGGLSVIATFPVA